MTAGRICFYESVPPGGRAEVQAQHLHSPDDELQKTVLNWFN